MEMTSLVMLAAGLILGSIIVWLYKKSASTTTDIPAEEYEKQRAAAQQLQTDLAVARARVSSVENELKETKDGSAQLNNNFQKTAQELEAMKAIRDTMQVRMVALEGELKETKEGTTQANNNYQKTAQELEALKVVRDTMQARFKEISDENKELNLVVATKGDQLNVANNTVARLQEEVKSKEDRLNNQKADFDEIKTKLESEFRIVARSILDSSAQQLTTQQTEKLNDLLRPFREQIDGFKKEIDTKFTTEAAEKGSLKQQIESLANLNHTIAKEALALTEALKGSTKKQGDWGEDILERILEYSGLQKDIHYFVQPTEKNEEGKVIRPDIKVRYPDNRFLVIDAKVSLVHYWDFCNAVTIEEQQAAMPKVVGSIKTHIDGLAGKRYIDIAGTPDFIVMFMPVEAAYIAAIQHDHTLWQYAYDRKILLISPTNLFPAMKMVSIMWDKDAVNRDGELIAKKAVGLYEKFHGFISTFEEVGSYMDKAQTRWREARGQLHTGKDNFISQGSKLKVLLGNKTKKELPAELVDAATTEDEMDGADNAKLQ